MKLDVTYLFRQLGLGFLRLAGLARELGVLLHDALEFDGLLVELLVQLHDLVLLLVNHLRVPGDTHT